MGFGAPPLVGGTTAAVGAWKLGAVVAGVLPQPVNKVRIKILIQIMPLKINLRVTPFIFQSPSIFLLIFFSDVPRTSILVRPRAYSRDRIPEKRICGSQGNRRARCRRFAIFGNPDFAVDNFEIGLERLPSPDVSVKISFEITEFGLAASQGVRSTPDFDLAVSQGARSSPEFASFRLELLVQVPWDYQWRRMAPKDVSAGGRHIRRALS